MAGEGGTRLLAVPCLAVPCLALPSLPSFFIISQASQREGGNDTSNVCATGDSKRHFTIQNLSFLSFCGGEGRTDASFLASRWEGVMDLSLIDFGSRVESLCCVCHSRKHSRKHELLPALRSSSMPTFEKACLDYP